MWGEIAQPFEAHFWLQMLVIPFLASQYDAWALDHMNTLIGEVKQLNEKIRLWLF